MPREFSPYSAAGPPTGRGGIHAARRSARPNLLADRANGQLAVREYAPDQRYTSKARLPPFGDALKDRMFTCTISGSERPPVERT